MTDDEMATITYETTRRCLRNDFLAAGALAFEGAARALIRAAADEIEAMAGPRAAYDIVQRLADDIAGRHLAGRQRDLPPVRAGRERRDGGEGAS